VGLLEIIGVNILLSGDNAAVIALAARSLPAVGALLAVGVGEWLTRRRAETAS
jgi:predicted tellurium resistance membrane protein TerC